MTSNITASRTGFISIAALAAAALLVTGLSLLAQSPGPAQPGVAKKPPAACA